MRLGRETAVGAMAGLLVVGATFWASPATAIDVNNGSPADTLRYSWDTVLSYGQSYRERTDAAAAQWDLRAQGTLAYDSSATNKVGLRYQDDIGLATVACGGNNCILWLKAQYATCDKFYTGTGSNPGVADSSVIGCEYNGQVRTDAGVC